MDLRTGQSLVSTTDTTTVIVVRASGADCTVTCGGAEMVDSAEGPTAPKTAPVAAHLNGTLLGKRYQTADGSLELLCTKAGPGSLAVHGVELSLKSAKPLPASD